MNMNMSRPHGRAAPDEELIDSLIAVSVIAKRLAEKLRKQMEKEKIFQAYIIMKRELDQKNVK